MTNQGGMIATYVLMSIGLLSVLIGVICKIVAVKKSMVFETVKSSSDPYAGILSGSSPLTDTGSVNRDEDSSPIDDNSAGFPVPTSFNFAKFGFDILKLDSYVNNKEYNRASNIAFIFANVCFLGAAAASLSHVDVSVAVIFNFLVTFFALCLSATANWGCKHEGWPTFLSALISAFAVISIVSEF